MSPSYKITGNGYMDEKGNKYGKVPGICWGKYVEQNGRYELTLNITVSHIFVDGYPLAQTFNKI